MGGLLQAGLDQALFRLIPASPIKAYPGSQAAAGFFTLRLDSP